MTVSWEGLREAALRFWPTLVAGDVQAGRALVIEQLNAGVPGSALITGLLVPAQRSAGLRWQAAQWTVADEHAATSVVDAALATIEHSRAFPASDAVAWLAVCAETEWHTLPARFAMQLAREGGANVRFLGASVPADHLREYLARQQPEGLLLSCTTPSALAGAARSIAAAHDVGVPVMVGGAAFGDDDRRARMLSADGWSADAASMRTWHPRRTEARAGERPRWDLFHAVQNSSAAAVSAAYERLFADTSPLGALTAPDLLRLRADLGDIVEILATSALVDDPRLTMRFVHWLDDVLRARNATSRTAALCCEALAVELDALHSADCAALLRRSAASIASRGIA